MKNDVKPEVTGDENSMIQAVDLQYKCVMVAFESIMLQATKELKKTFDDFSKETIDSVRDILSKAALKPTPPTTPTTCKS